MISPFLPSVGCLGLVFPSYLHLLFLKLFFRSKYHQFLFVDNLHLTLIYATPNILEILKTKIKLRLKEGESPISFIYQSMLPDQAN